MDDVGPIQSPFPQMGLSPNKIRGQVGMKMNHDSVECRRRDVPAGGANADDWFPWCEGVLERAGDFVWLTNRDGKVTDLLLWVPGDEGGSIAPVPVQVGPQSADQRGPWGWDGNMERPTLTPSIWRMRAFERDGVLVQPRNEWHGNLVVGRLVSE